MSSAMIQVPRFDPMRKIISQIHDCFTQLETLKRKLRESYQDFDEQRSLQTEIHRVYRDFVDVPYEKP
nr:uncharacterized protein CI109_007365 [Kwoniella shandongensis]KAA5524318.1 hypothetical protein CI109_007365 [Kwoniella shandongensis]